MACTACEQRRALLSKLGRQAASASRATSRSLAERIKALHDEVKRRGSPPRSQG